MQIFWLHENHKRNAQLYNDKHCSKIILEIAQIISTAARKNGAEHEKLYKKTHENHPCVKWAEESTDNIFNALSLMYELNQEKKRRFDSGSHASFIKMWSIPWMKLLEDTTIPDREKTVPPQAFRDCPKALTEGETWGDVIKGYRRYYQLEKAEISEWNHTNTPNFMSEWV